MDPGVARAWVLPVNGLLPGCRGVRLGVGVGAGAGFTSPSLGACGVTAGAGLVEGVGGLTVGEAGSGATVVAAAGAWGDGSAVLAGSAAWAPAVSAPGLRAGARRTEPEERRRGAADFFLTPMDSRKRRATGGSTVEDADLANSPMSFNLSRTSLLSRPSSLASSYTRTFDTSLLS